METGSRVPLAGPPWIGLADVMLCRHMKAYVDSTQHSVDTRTPRNRNTHVVAHQHQPTPQLSASETQVQHTSDIQQAFTYAAKVRQVLNLISQRLSSQHQTPSAQGRSTEQRRRLLSPLLDTRVSPAGHGQRYEQLPALMQLPGKMNDKTSPMGNGYVARKACVSQPLCL